jgi:UDP-N-acetylglucosamine 2-epimerase
LKGAIADTSGVKAAAKVLTVVGARPQFIKVAAVHDALKEHGQPVQEVLVHTGQHYDDELSRVFFEDLSLPEADENLNVGSGSHGAQTGAMMTRLEPIVERESPDVVVVYGDTNSTLAAALVAAKLKVPVAHVEAGMRAGRIDIPEEVNRVVVDHLSSLLFCPTEHAVENLVREGIGDGVTLTGDVMHDLLVKYLPAIDARNGLLDELRVRPNEYTLVTIHRAGNTDDPTRLRNIVRGLEMIGDTCPVVFPVHPRTRAALGDSGSIGVPLLDPVGYLDMLCLEKNARVIVTDSGGVQREAFWLDVPAVTIRDETEWVETLQHDWNVLVDADPDAIASAAQRPAPSRKVVDKALEGASDKIVTSLLRWLEAR